MRKYLIAFICVFGIYSLATAQQDAMFTKYMFNGMTYNPGYTGSKEHLSVNAIHRTQWWNIEGAPSTQSFSIHTPIPNERIALGINLTRDEIGPTRTVNVNLAYAYRFNIGAGKLSVGMQGGMMNWRADWSGLNPKHEDDEAFAETQPNYWLPNFGLGLYYSTPMWYVGAGAPHLIEWDLRRNEINTKKYARTYRHYFVSAGGALELGSSDWVLKPSILIKHIGVFENYTVGTNGSTENYTVSAPTEFDLDVSILMKKFIWVGMSLRSAIEAEAFGGSSSFDSVDAWVALMFDSGLRVGLAYDYPLNPLSDYTIGSAEIMLGYEFGQEKSHIVTPRYF